VVLLALLIVPRLVLLSWLANPEPRYTVEFFPFVSALAAVWIASRDHEMHTTEQASPSMEATQPYRDTERAP
jgi:hypothetical protein